jgi:hypothetical protein
LVLLLRLLLLLPELLFRRRSKPLFVAGGMGPMGGNRFGPMGAGAGLVEEGQLSPSRGK